MIFVVLAYFVLSYLAGVLAPILTALGSGYRLNPVLERLVRTGLSRAAGAGVLLATFVAILAIVITFFAPTVAHQISEFVTNLPTFVGNLETWAKEHLGVQLPS